MDLQQTAQHRIDRIEQVLAAMTKAVEQEKAEVAKLSWSAVGSLGYIATKLEEIEDFWLGSAP